MGISREIASFGAFLRHVAEIPIKLVKRGNGNRCCFGYVPETPIKLVQNRVDRATAGPDANIREPIKSKRQPSRGTPIRRKIRRRRETEEEEEEEEEDDDDEEEKEEAEEQEEEEEEEEEDSEEKAE